MLKAYVVGISNQYENEDIEIRYRVIKDDDIVLERKMLEEYKKPLIVSHFAFLALLGELEKYKEEEITIIINDAALMEQIKGTSTTKNKDVMKMARIVREKLNKFNGSIVVKDVSGNYSELMLWSSILKF